ncbi:MAG TPA: hypothetical protein DEQ68_00315 [Ruminococcaceae bacterium]|nr:hypothetical protein [Oscillospiraceae bacterium]
MKKIISMGIASAVLALTAVAASAAITATTADKAVNGKTVKVQITTDADVEAFGFNLAAEGLTATAADVQADGMIVAADAADGSINVNGISLDGFKAGTVLATVTYTVTAETDADVAVALSNMPGMTDTYTGLTLKVVAEGAADLTDPTDPTDPDQPSTGVALAVVPAVLAGAAVVVAKKRK